MVQRVQRSFGGGDDLYAMAFEQGAGTESGRLQRGVDDVVIMVGRVRPQPDVDAEGFGEDPVEPHAGRRAPAQVIMGGEPVPDGAGIGFRGAAVPGRHAQQIGRAPCRERVCRSGSISVVAAAYKKKNKTPPTT